MIVEGNKFACDACIRGHRVTGCEHVDRQLTQIAKKGRPVSQCSSCRQSRKSRGTHNKCECGTKEPNTIPAGGLVLVNNKEYQIGPGIQVCLCNDSKNYVCKCCQRQRETLDTVPEVHEGGSLPNATSIAPQSFISRPRALIPTMSETSLHSLGAQYGKHPRPLHARHSHQYSVPYQIPVGSSAERLGNGPSRRIRSEHSSPTLDPVSGNWAGDMPPPLDLLNSTIERPLGLSPIAPAMASSRPTPRQTPLHSPLSTPITSVHSSVLTADSLQKPVSSLGAVMEEPLYESSTDSNMVSMFQRPSVAAISGEGSGLLNSTRIAHSRSLQPLSVNTAQAQYGDFSGESYLTSAPPSATTAFFHQPAYSIGGYSDMDGTPSSRAPTVAGSNYGDAGDYGGPGSPQTPFTPAIGNGLFVEHSGNPGMNPSEGYEQVGASMGLSVHYSQRNSAVGLSNVSSDSSDYPDPNISRRPSLASSSYSNFNALPSTDSFGQWPIRSGDQTPALFGSQLSLYHENYEPNDSNMYAMSGNVSDDETDFICMAPPARRQIENQKAIAERQQVELQQWANQRLTQYNNNSNTMAVNVLES